MAADSHAFEAENALLADKHFDFGVMADCAWHTFSVS
jgi:hypothetical protein